MAYLYNHKMQDSQMDSIDVIILAFDYCALP